MRIKLNKSKGLSLVELITAVAISSIVLLMVTAVITSTYNSYNKENARSDVQNKLQLTFNNISDAIMEGNTIIMSNAGGTSVMTSEVASDVFTNKTGKHIYYDSSSQTVYLCDKPFSQLSDAEKKGSILANNVTGFKIEIDDSCKVSDPVEGVSYTNPVKIKVRIVAKERMVEEEYTQTIVMRNKFKSLTIGTEVFDVK